MLVRNRVTGFAIALLFWTLTPRLSADVRVPHVFGNDMILQQQMDVPIWGWASPGESVTVKIAGQEVTAIADAKGNWRVKLAPLSAPGPYILTIVGKNTLQFTNVAVGEVWLCSGQSNMDFGMNQVRDAKAEISKANFPQIRLLDMFYKTAPSPENDADVHWKICTPTNLATGGFFNSGFTAVGYYFGRELHTNLNVPVGLIKSAWGGTRIEPWTPREGFELHPQFAEIVKKIDSATPKYKVAIKRALPEYEKWLAKSKKAVSNDVAVPEPPAWPKHELNDSGQPTGIYNGIVHPLVGFAMRGAIWYQGESNRGDGPTYTERMKALIDGWRKIWREGNFPFYYVQIAPFRYGDNPEETMRIWEAQLNALSITNTGMAVTTDLVDNIADIHPHNKNDVGHRLALWALAKTYGRTDLIYSGPLFESASADGNKLRLKFKYAADGLKSRDGKPLTWFEVAGADGKLQKANASIEGKDTIVVSSSEVTAPTQARFGWNQEAMPNLVNSAGLPASPFRCAVNQ